MADIGKLRLTSEYPAFIQIVDDIDGAPYRFRFYWDDRNESWFYSFGTEEEWIVQGKRLVCGRLMASVQHENMPDVRLFCYAITPDRSPPGRWDLGRRCFVAFFSEDIIE